MSQNANLQERYSSIVEAKLRATSVFANLFNNRYEGDPKAGAVKVPVRADATASAYNIASGLAMTAPATTYETIVLDNDYAVHELIDGYAAEAVPDKMVADRLDSAGYALGSTIDATLLAALKTGTGAADTSTNIIKKIIKTVAKAVALGVDPNKIWIAVSPDTQADIITDDLFVHASGDVKSNVIGTLGGTPVVMSNRMTDPFIVANSDFCHFVNEWKVAPHVADLADGVHIGASAVEGREIFGYLVSKPETVFVGA